MSCHSKPTQMIKEDCDNQVREVDPAVRTRQTPERPVVSPDEELRIRLRMYLADDDDDGSNKYIIPGREQASVIHVLPSESPDYWVWERSFSNDSSEVRWSIRPFSSSHLYITHNNSEDVSLESNGENRYFIIELGSRGGYAIRVPASNKFIGYETGKLVLSETMTEWHVWIPPEGRDPVLQNVVQINHAYNNDKWVIKFLHAEAYIVVETDGPTSLKSRWKSITNTVNHTRTFSPADDDKLFVTCKPETNEIILETADKADKKNRKFVVLDSSSPVSELMNFDRTKYVTANQFSAGGRQVLRLTDNKIHATKWRFPLMK